jgi:hypothetical protein
MWFGKCEVCGVYKTGERMRAREVDEASGGGAALVLTVTRMRGDGECGGANLPKAERNNHTLLTPHHVALWLCRIA